MRVRDFIFIIVAAFLSEGAAVKDIPQSPDPELLEFLGTFAEDGKKDIDPMDLADFPGDERTPLQFPPKKSVEGKEKKEGKGNQR
jgi:hypothetical protein